jgi:Domain of unknown function (DUF4260)
MPPRRDLPTAFLRLEGLVLFGLATFLYALADASWLMFVVLLLLPDVGMLGYIRDNRVGAVVYNAFHTYLPPALLAVIGMLAGADLPVLLALIWFAHIGMDRVLGYGLKYPSAFRDTHLGTIGRARERRQATAGRPGTAARPRPQGPGRSPPRSGSGPAR